MFVYAGIFAGNQGKKCFKLISWFLTIKMWSFIGMKTNWTVILLLKCQIFFLNNSILNYLYPVD